MSKWIERECKCCGEKFYAQKSDIPRGWGNFCSQSCNAKYHNSLRPPAKSKKRLNAIARELYIKKNGLPSCSHCGAVPADIHHLNEDRTDNSKENLIALCRSCHVAYHNHVKPKRQRKAA